MRFKVLLYLTISALIAALIGTTLTLFYSPSLGCFITNHALTLAKVVALAMIVLNGTLVHNNRAIVLFGVSAIAAITGKMILLLNFNVSLLLQLAGILSVFFIYAYYFLKKGARFTLDFLKILWLAAQTATSVMVVLNLYASSLFGHITSVLFFTMTFFFIWISHYRKQAIPTAEIHQAE